MGAVQVDEIILNATPAWTLGLDEWQRRLVARCQRFEARFSQYGNRSGRRIKMKSRRHLEWVLVALILMALGTGNLLAQDGENAGIPTNLSYPNNPGGPANAGTPSNGPPARVARIQYITGEVSLQPGGVNDWVAADLNRPLTSADRVWADKNSRVELQGVVPSL